MSLWTNRNFSIMLLKEANELITNKEYLYEIKFDGIRACIFVNNNSLRIISRNKKDITSLFPELQNIKSSFSKNTILDGEIISIENNNISFETLQNRLHLKNKERIHKLSFEKPVIFVAFDILYLDNDLIDLPLIKRKQLLNKIKENEYLIKSKSYKDSVKLFDFVKHNNIEGIVAKLKNSKYLINTRSDNWIKIKNYQIDNFYIGGYEKKKENYISIKLGEYHDNKLIYIGSVSLVKSNKLYQKVINLKKVKKSPFSNYDENIIYIVVKLKCQVKYINRTKNSQLRQPILIGDSNEIKRL